MTAAISRQADLKVAGASDEIGDALERYANQSLAAAVLDLTASPGTIVEAVRVLHTAVPELPILVVGPETEPACALRALRAGAKGFITYRESIEQFLTALRKVASGQVYLGEVFREQLITELARGEVGASPSGIDRLTEREREVLQLLGGGNTTREIARTLSLSVKTIETHRAHIKEKLGLRNAAELLRFAVEASVSR
jgi:DNA-binding NarL/FixJ family response regulator